MGSDDILGGLRADAKDQIASNALALNQAPSLEPSDAGYGLIVPGGWPDGLGDGAPGQAAGDLQTLSAAPATDDKPGLKDLGSAAVDSAEAALDSVKAGLPAAKTNAERAAKTVGWAAAKAPGKILSAVDVLTAKDKPRALAGVVGGEIGGVLGGLIPGAEPLTVPIGAFLGNQAGKFVHDTAGQVVEKAARGFQKGVQMFEHGFDRGLPPFVTPMR